MFEDELTPTRRQFPRIPAEDVVLIHRIGPADQVEETMARQIGLGGLMISSVESLGVDSYLRLKLTIDGEEIEATGRVVWEKPAKDDDTFDVGVAFISIDAAHSETIMARLVAAGAS
jgi:Tfp pilus assembly protein PilZ